MSPWWDETGEEIYLGRSNLGAISLNLPKMALEARGDWDKFYQLVNKYAKMAFDISKDYKIKVSKQKASSDPLYYSEGGSFMKLDPDETVGPIVDAMTSSLGYIGIFETLTAMNVAEIEMQKIGIEVVQHLKDLVNQATVDYDMLFALYSSPAESLCYRFQNINKKDYGEIKNVTDREYITNSFHLPVWIDSTVPDKIDFESPFHQIATGGKISYNEYVFGVDESVLEQAIDYAMSKGLYYGVNVISSTCSECGESGDFHDECPKCHSHNITVVSRVCGYLSFDQIHGDSRYNKGKQKEVQQRVKHSTKFSMK